MRLGLLYCSFLCASFDDSVRRASYEKTHEYQLLDVSVSQYAVAKIQSLLM
jgi:hypothetical protein